MLRISVEPTFTRAVTFEMCDPKTGEKISLTATFRALTETQQAAFDLTTLDGSKRFLRASVVSLDGLVDDEGKPVAYADSVREALIDARWVRMGLANAYFAGINGLVAGNFGGLPAAGQPATSQPSSTATAAEAPTKTMQ